MHIILIAIGLLFVFTVFLTLGPKNFIKLVLGGIVAFVLSCILIIILASNCTINVSKCERKHQLQDRWWDKDKSV